MKLNRFEVERLPWKLAEEYEVYLQLVQNACSKPAPTQQPQKRW